MESSAVYRNSPWESTHGGTVHLMKWIGFDIGSTSVKSVLFDSETETVLDEKNTPTPERIAGLPPENYEISAAAIADRVLQVIDSYTASTQEIGAVLIASQMHGFVYRLPGREDRYISWQDMRCLRKMSSGETYLARMEQLIPPETMRSHGVYLKPSLGLCNLYAMFLEDPELSKNGELFTLGSYVTGRLMKRRSSRPEDDRTESERYKNITHATSAAPVGIVNVRDGVIDRTLPEILGFDSIRLPSLASEDTVIGTILSNGQTLQIYPDVGDMQIAVLGSRPASGDGVVNAATAAQVICPAQKFLPGDYEVRPYFGGQYVNVISNMPGGRNLAVLATFFKEVAETLSGQEIPEDRIWKEMHRIPDTAGRELRADVNFYENPHFPEGGSISGIDQYNLHMNTVFRAAVDNMAKTCWEYMCRLGQGPESIRKIICAGGVSWKTPELLESLRRMSGKECVLSEREDEAAAGLMHLAAQIRSHTRS